MKVVVEGATKLDGSYGLVNAQLAAAMARRGIDVRISPWDQADEACRAALAEGGLLGSEGLEVSSHEESVPDVRIRQIWPPVWAKPADGSRLVVIQPWEFGSVPVSWLEGIQAADAIWVPTSYVKAGYVQSGVDPAKVWVIPNGTDLAVPWDQVPEHGTAGHLSLLFLGGGIVRKGVDVLIAALGRLPDTALGRLDLTIKESGADSYYAGQSLVDKCLAENPRAATITTVLRNHLSRPDLLSMISRSDALIHPYRSEGFGLPVLEAMAAGVPVVVTEGGATGDFCGPAEGHFIPSNLTLMDRPFVGDLLTVDYPYVREPSVDHLESLLMRMVSGEVDLGATRRAAWKRAQSYTWDAIAELASTSLQRLVAGSPCEDNFLVTHHAVRQLVADPERTNWMETTRQLILAGDVHSARQAMDLVRAGRPADPRVVVTRRQLGETVTGPDLWSGSPWRLDLVGESRDHSPVPAVVHRHEGSRHAVSAIAEAIMPYFAGCRTILDIGCGQGAMLRALRATGRTVAGLEGDPDLCAALRSEGLRVEEGWIPDDLRLFEEERFDGVFMGHIIEHLSTESALNVLRWVAQHLNDGGVVAIQTPNFALDIVSKSNFWLDPTHVRPYPLELLKGMLESVGLAPLAGGCRPLTPEAPLDVLAVARIRHRQDRSAVVKRSAPPAVNVGTTGRSTMLRVLHIGMFSSEAGMAHAARRLLDERVLASNGAELIRVEVGEGTLPGDGPFTCTLADVFDLVGDVAVIDVPVGWLPQIMGTVRAPRRIVRLAYEAVPLPAYLAKILLGVDEIWAMSQFVAESAQASGIPGSMITVIPPTITPAAVGAGRPPRTGAPAIFSSIFNFEPRKNPEALMRAFAAVLRRGHDAGLIVKTSGVDEQSYWQWTMATLGEGDFSLVRDRCSVITAQLEDGQIRSLLQQSDAFVLPTRGEGFGLPFLEAMSVGVPSICPDIGGHRDFCDHTTSYIVPSTSSPCLATWGIPLFRESRWREVVFGDLVSAMETVVVDPEDAARRGAESLRRARSLTGSNRDLLAVNRILDVDDRS